MTGFILKARIKKLPLFYHYGITIEEQEGIKVIHNTPNKKNEFGGNIVVDDLKEWTKTRTIVRKIKTNVTRQQIEEAVSSYAAKPFNLFGWNCEHFIFKIKDGHPRSPQLSEWIYNSVLFGFFIFSALKKSKKRFFVT